MKLSIRRASINTSRPIVFLPKVGSSTTALGATRRQLHQSLSHRFRQHLHGFSRPNEKPKQRRLPTPDELYHPVQTARQRKQTRNLHATESRGARHCRLERKLLHRLGRQESGLPRRL